MKFLKEPCVKHWSEISPCEIFNALSKFSGAHLHCVRNLLMLGNTSTTSSCVMRYCSDSVLLQDGVSISNSPTKSRNASTLSKHSLNLTVAVTLFFELDLQDVTYRPVSYDRLVHKLLELHFAFLVVD